MSLPSNNLDAFQEIAKTGSFSLATKVLNISQSALSQRIKNLEEEMGLTLFVRLPTGVRLTEQGEKLLRYCQTRDSLEEELVQDLNMSNYFDIAGTFRVAGHSSVLRSVLIPALSGLLREHPNILCEFSCANMESLPGMLQRAEVDFIVMDYELEASSLETEILGQEKFVVIEAQTGTDRKDVFLDNDSNDRVTESFFKIQTKNPPKYRRSYFDDCYGIIDGVRAGLGRSVMSEHLVKGDKSLRVLKGYKSLKADVVLHYHKQPFYSKLQKTVLSELKKHCRFYLSK